MTFEEVPYLVLSLSAIMMLCLSVLGLGYAYGLLYLRSAHEKRKSVGTWLFAAGLSCCIYFFMAFVIPLRQIASGPLGQHGIDVIVVLFGIFLALLLVTEVVLVFRNMSKERARSFFGVLIGVVVPLVPFLVYWYLVILATATEADYTADALPILLLMILVVLAVIRVAVLIGTLVWLGTPHGGADSDAGTAETGPAQVSREPLSTS